MENSTRQSRGSQTQSSTSKPIRSGYEPSDTETEWHETPWHDRNKKIGDVDSEELKFDSDQERNTSPLKLNRRRSAKVSSPIKAPKASPARRRHSKSPYKPRRDDNTIRSPTHVSQVRKNISPFPSRQGSEILKNVSPFSKSERRRHDSPYKSTREIHDLGNDEFGSSNKKKISRHANDDATRVTGKSKYSNRSASAPRQRSRDKDQHIDYDLRELKRGDPSPLRRDMPPKDSEATHKNAPSVGEINEIVANAKISRGLDGNAPIMESTESISPGDIFFSHNIGALTMQNIIFSKTGGSKINLSSKSNRFTDKFHGSHQVNNTNGSSNHNIQGNSSSTVLTRVSTVSSSAVSRQSSNLSDTSGRTNGTWRKFTANRQKIQTDGWLSCIKKGSCRRSKQSPEKDRAFDEASFIEKAFVVENLRQFWADKHQPAALNEFTCHKKEAQLLKQLVSHDLCPHVLLKGPPGSGKKVLTMAFLHEIYGDPSWNISHDIRYFQIQETKSMQVAVPVTSSPHHVELNVHSEPNAKYALMALVKQISANHEVTPEISNVNFKADFTVMVLYDVEKAAENIQHLIKWIMDCYTDVCKLVLCCEDDADIIESVKNRTKLIKIDPPVTHEIMEVLIQIARKENFDISMSFAAKIATKSKQNLRKAIMALEACKAHNYPFAEDQPIPMGWEEIIVDLAAEILADPSPNRVLSVRGKFQRLLVDFVHPKLILQKLVEQFLKGVESSLKRELYYWHGYYDKRLPMGASALLKLEEFVAKFMGIYRKTTSCRQYS